MNKDWNSSTSDYGENPMEVKRYGSSQLYQEGGLLKGSQTGPYVLYDDIKHLLTRPDPKDGWKVKIESDDCEFDSANCEHRRGQKVYVCRLLQGNCTQASCPLLFTQDPPLIPRPDPAEVKKLVDKLIEEAIQCGLRGNIISAWVDQARADLLKLVGGGE